MLSDTIKKTVEACKPETLLFLACCRFSPSESEINRMRSIAGQVYDWSEVITLAGRHGLVSPVYRNLRLHLNDFAPFDLVTELQKSYMFNTMSSLRLASELGRVSKLFDTGKIPILCLKGPALSMRLYADVAFRSYGDLDVLTHVDNIDRAEEILHTNGYERRWPELRLTSRRKDFFFKTFHHFNYYNRDRRFCIELHFTPCHNMYESLSSIDDTVTLECRGDKNYNLRVGSLPDSQMLLYLCEHGSNHAWHTLKWLVDVSELLFTMQAADWESIARKALKHGLERSLTQGVALAHGILGAPYPEALRNLIKPNTATIKMIAFALGEIRLTQTKPSAIPIAFRTIPYNIRMRRGLKYKLAALRRKWVTTAQFRDFLLHDTIFPLYLILRPIFWLLALAKEKVSSK